MKKRLTKRDKDGNAVAFNYIKTAGEFKEIVDRLAEYEDLEEQGLIVRLPCKVGGKIYAMGQYTRDFAEFEITSITLRADKYSVDKFYIAKDFNANMSVRFEEQNIGKWVFLTRTEAEKKLKELKGELK